MINILKLRTKFIQLDYYVDSYLDYYIERVYDNLGRVDYNLG